MIRTLLAQAGPSLLPALVLALIALAAWVTSLVANHIRDRRYAAAVTLLAYGAAGVAADFAQHAVEALKDPTKLGTWSAVTGAAIRLQAIALLRQLYPLAVDFVTRVLRDPTKVDVLLGTLLERAVVDLKARVPASLPASLPAPLPAQLRAPETLASLAADPVPLDRPTVAPPEPIAPVRFDSTQTLTLDVTEEVRESARRRGEGGNARVVVLLLIVAALGLAALVGLHR